MPGIDHRHGHAAAGEAGRVAVAGPHLIGADRHVGDRHRRPQRDVAGEMIDVGVALQRVELTGVHAQHAAALHAPLDDDVVARGERVDRRPVAVDDDVDRLRAGGEVIGQVGAEARAMLRRSRAPRSRPGGAGPRTRRGEAVLRPDSQPWGITIAQIARRPGAEIREAEKQSRSEGPARVVEPGRSSDPHSQSSCASGQRRRAVAS